MKLTSLAAILLCGTALGANAQQRSSTPQNPNTTVLFSRSEAQTGTKPSPLASIAPSAPATLTKQVTNADRAALTFTAYKLDVHLDPQDHHLAARAVVTVRNDGAQPIVVLPLQLSSSLKFQGVSLHGQPLPFARQTLNSDTDHTGQLNEADVELPTPLAPHTSITLAAVYSGDITVNAKRLTAIGTPADDARHSDWDRISENFTGLRGFGNVVWYPVASVPALLGDGNQVFAEIGRQKLRQRNAMISIRLTLEFYLAPPSVIVLDGHSIPVPKPSVTPTSDYPGILTCELPPTKLGFDVPSLFLADWPLTQSNGLNVYAQTAHQANVQDLTQAATLVQPLVQKWLGPKQKSPLTVIDLPESSDLAWEQNTLLLTPIVAHPATDYTAMLAGALAHAYFHSPRQWLNDGVPTFVETQWIAHTQDRTRALEWLEPQRAALALIEPGTPGASLGEPLIRASQPIYYRTKATFVLWMLSELTGPKGLAAALQAYVPANDTTPEYFQKLVEQAAQATFAPESNKSLQWFFNDWVYNDRGLPDLSIASFHFSPTRHADLYLAAIDIRNSGTAEADVPVTVRSGTNTQTQYVLVPGKNHTAYRMLVQGQPTEVIVNDGTIPEVASDIHTQTISSQ